jgi:outer membrane protein assembly factor BamB
MVYITHNTWSETFQGYMRGRLSVFRNDFDGMGGEVPMNGAGAMGFADKDAPFGPVSVVTKLDGSDHVYWGEAWDEGRASYGLLYRFDSGTFGLTGLAPTSWSTITAPTLSADGSSMWLGGQGSCIHGWPRGHSFAERPAWSVAVDPDAAVAPISTRLAVSADEARVCGSSPGTGLFCLNATTGGLLWSDENSGPGYASSIFSADGYFLFSILVSIDATR